MFRKLASNPSAASCFPVRCGSQSCIHLILEPHLSNSVYYSTHGQHLASAECRLLTKFSRVIILPSYFSLEYESPPMQRTVPGTLPAHLQEQQQQQQRQPGAASYVHVWVGTGQSLGSVGLTRSQASASQPVTSVLVTLEYLDPDT